MPPAPTATATTRALLAAGGLAAATLWLVRRRRRRAGYTTAVAADAPAEPASCAASAALFVARWAEGRADFEADFAARGVGRRVLAALPTRWLPRPALAAARAACAPHLAAHEITDGNVNFSFGVRGRGGRALFVKNARGFLKWQPQMALERSRMAREVAYFSEARAALGAALADEYLPAIHGFDAASSVVVMEYLGDFGVMYDACFDAGAVSERAAAGLGEYLGRLHARTLSPAPGQPGLPAACRRAVEFANPALRSIQLEHVYTACFAGSARGAALAAEPAVMEQVALLKAKYAGASFDGRDRFALCHGDLHPGGVMVAADGRAKVIDPEFVVWGPPGLDVGSLTSGLVLAHLYREQCCAGSPARAAAGALPMAAAAARLWASYEAAMADEGVGAEQLARVGEDAVGFAMMEVCRTSLGFAGARDPARRIRDAAALDAYQETATRLVRHCLLRRGAGGMRVLLESLGRLGELPAA